VKNLKNDNKGLTLIELIISIVILGLLISPLLHAFVVSSDTAKKSRETDAVTNAATNFVENIKAGDIDTVLRYISNGTLFGADAAFNTADTVAADGYYVADISGLEYGIRTYSGKLTLDAKAYRQENPDTALLGINNTPVVKYSFSGLRFGTEMRDFDLLAAKSLEEVIYTEDTTRYLEDLTATGGTLPTPQKIGADVVLQGMVRNLTLTVKDITPLETDLAKKQLSVTAECEYFYTHPVHGIVEPSTAFTWEYFGPYDTALYFFYYPLYANTAAGAENISIINEAGLDFAMFLVKQKPWQTALELNSGNEFTADMWMQTQDNIYVSLAKTRPFVTLKQTVAAGQTGAAVYSNIGASLNGSVTDDLYYNLILNGSMWSTREIMQTSLVELETADRIYKITLELADDELPDSRTVVIETTTLDFPAE